MKTGWHVLVQIGPSPTNVEDIGVNATDGPSAVQIAWGVLVHDMVANWDEETPYTEKDCRIIGVYPGRVG